MLANVPGKTYLYFVGYLLHNYDTYRAGYFEALLPMVTNRYVLNRKTACIILSKANIEFLFSIKILTTCMLIEVIAHEV